MHKLTDDDLVAEIIAFLMNRKKKHLDLRVLDLFEKLMNKDKTRKVEEDDEKMDLSVTSRRSAVNMHFQNLSLNESGTSISNDTSMMDESQLHPKYALFTPAKKAAPSHAYHKRKDSGKIIYSHTGRSFSSFAVGRLKAKVEIILPGPVEELYHYGYEKDVKIIEAISRKIDQLTELIIATHENLSGHEHCDFTASGDFVIYGQIMAKGNEGLGSHNCYLEVGGETKKILRLDLENLKSYSLFPGKVVVFSGSYSESRSLFTPTSLYEPNIPDLSPVILRTPGQFKIWCAAGPFSSPDTLSYEQLYDLLDLAKKEVPDVLILVGPILDRTSSAFLSPENNITFTDLVECLLVSISELIANTNMQVVIVPNAKKDLVCVQSYPTGPQKVSSECEKLISKNIIFAPDPTFMCIDGVQFAATSSEILRHLSRQELHYDIDAESDDRMSRIIRQLFLQRSIYPLFPASDDSPLFPHVAQNWIKVNRIPHVLIIPSALAPMVKIVEGCICVNTGFLARGSGGGAFMKMSVNLSSVDRKIHNLEKFSLQDHCDVQIVRI